MPRRILKSRRVRAALAIFAGYWGLSFFVKPLHMAQVLTLVLVFVAIGVIVKYSKQVWEATVSDDLGPISQLAQGILLAFSGLFVGLVWAMIGRVVPGAEWMQRSPVVGFYLLCYVVAGTLHMTARRNEDGRVSASDVRDVVIAYGIGLSLSIILMILQLGGVLREP